MILTIAQIINYIVVVYIITTLFLEKRKFIKHKNLKIFCLVGLLFLITLGKYGIWVYGLGQVVISYFFIHLLFIGEKKEKIILIFAEIASLSNVSVMLESIISITCLILHFKPDRNIINIIIGGLIMMILIMAKYKMREKCNLESQKIGVKYAFFFMLLVIIECFMVTGMGELIYKEVAMTRKFVFEIAYILMVIFMFIQIGLMIALLISRNVYREKEYLAAKYLEEQKLHYEYLENRELQTKKFRHDIKNHLLIVNDLIHKKQYKECEAYLEETSIRIDRFSYKISVNNGIADAIVNKFYMEAEQKGIALHVKGHLPSPCNLSAFDICTIISNLLSNAIEAEVASRGNDVYVEFRYTDTDIMMEVKNNFEQDLEQRSGVFFTTKEDKANHGFGLANVKECVQKNGGQITISTDNHVFKVLVCVNNGE